MKSFAILLALASIVVASPSLVVDDQTPLAVAEYAGYDLDLAQLRLVQVEGKEPEWISELDKASRLLLSAHRLLTFLQINLKTQGVNFFDM